MFGIQLLSAKTSAGAAALLAAATLGAGLAPGLEAQPLAPSQVRAAPLSDERVRLRWQDNACDETSQHVQLFTGNRWVEIPFSLPPGETQIILTGLDASTPYTFRIVARSLDGSSASPASSVTTFASATLCATSSRRLCLMDGRFAVTVKFEYRHDAGVTEQARAVPDTDSTGSFWFFDANNLELSVEMIDGREANGHFWISAGGLSNLGYEMTVLDTHTGEERLYVNPTRSLCGIDDRRAFAVPVSQPAGSQAADPLVARTDALAWTPPAKPLEVERASARIELAADEFRPGFVAAKSFCASSLSSLRLHEGRFQVGLSWLDEGELRTAEARFDTSNSGYFVAETQSVADWALKILDGRVVNDHYWVFFSPLSGLESWLEIYDTVTGETEVLHSPLGSRCAQVQLDAFRAAP